MAVLDFCNSKRAATLTERERELLKYFRQLPFDRQDTHIDFMRMYVDKDFRKRVREDAQAYMQRAERGKKEKPLSDPDAKRKALKILANDEQQSL